MTESNKAPNEAHQIMAGSLLWIWGIPIALLTFFLGESILTYAYLGLAIFMLSVMKISDVLLGIWWGFKLVLFALLLAGVLWSWLG